MRRLIVDVIAIILAATFAAVVVVTMVESMGVIDA